MQCLPDKNKEDKKFNTIISTIVFILIIEGWLIGFLYSFFTACAIVVIFNIFSHYEEEREYKKLSTDKK